MIIASSMTLLADSRAAGAGGGLPWALLAAGSAASLAANMAVAEPTTYGRVIAAWPSFALIGAYELLMRQIRHAATAAAPGSNSCLSRSGHRPIRWGQCVGSPCNGDSRDLGSARRHSVEAGTAGGRSTERSRLDDADLLTRARNIDAEHRAEHDRPASAKTLRIRLRIGAASARALKNRLRAASAGPTPPMTRTSTG